MFKYERCDLFDQSRRRGIIVSVEQMLEFF